MHDMDGTLWLTDYQRQVAELLKDWRAPDPEATAEGGDPYEWEIIWTGLVFTIARRLKIKPAILFVEYCKGTAVESTVDRNVEVLIPVRFYGDVDFLISALELDGIL